MHTMDMTIEGDKNLHWVNTYGEPLVMQSKMESTSSNVEYDSDMMAKMKLALANKVSMQGDMVVEEDSDMMEKMKEALVNKVEAEMEVAMEAEVGAEEAAEMEAAMEVAMEAEEEADMDN